MPLLRQSQIGSFCSKKWGCPHMKERPQVQGVCNGGSAQQTEGAEIRKAFFALYYVAVILEESHLQDLGSFGASACAMGCMCANFSDFPLLEASPKLPKSIPEGCVSSLKNK